MPTTILTLPQSNLAKNATFNSVPNPGAIALPSQCDSLTCTLSMSTADQSNAVNAVSWIVYVALPGPAPTQPPPFDGTPTNGWIPIAFEQWQGGVHNAHNGTPNVPNGVTFTESVPPQYQGGWVAAAGRNIGSTLRVGCTITSNP